MSPESAPRATLELARFARDCVREKLGGGLAERPQGEVYAEPGASFVTLRWPEGELQGCIGSLEARRSLAADVASNAAHAAFHDPRGQELTLQDVDELAVEVSVLSPLEPIVFDGTEEGARAALRPGIDGVVLSWRGRRGTFLPQMWEQLPTPELFLNELKLKAGLPMDFWAPGVELLRYTVDHATDPSPQPLTFS
jgi:AmmeMemoRadiSam system protein A